MLISDKYSEYGVTGAFFWVTQLFVILVISEKPLEIWRAWMMIIEPFFEVIPATLKVSIAGVLAALGIMAIFVAGLLLDLLGSYYIIPETFIFRHQIEKNRDWLSHFVEENSSFIKEDFDYFLTHPENFWKFEKYRFGIFPGTSPRSYLPFQKRVLPPKDYQEYQNLYRFAESYNRLQSLLMSYISVNPVTPNMNAFYDQIQLWRTSKAISFALLIVAIEIFLNFSFKIMKDMLTALGDFFMSINSSTGQVSVQGYVLNELLSLFLLLTFSVIFLIIYYFSVAIANQSYFRMCSNLFAIVYSLEKIKSNKNEEPSTPLREDAGIA
jgi:hypothetical protein